MKLNFRSIFFLVLFIAGMDVPAAANQQPNIVFILADDLGFADLGYHGSQIRTPSIDGLARDGIVLSRSYVQPQCTPTRTAFITGRYPYRHGLHEHIIGHFSKHGLPEDVKTLPLRLKELGYYTALVGKWHLGLRRRSYLPNQKGFDYFFGLNGGRSGYWNYSVLGQVDLNRNGEKVYPAFNGFDEASGNPYMTDVIADDAVNVIRGHDGRNPLFLYLSFTAPHTPLQAPETLKEYYKTLELDPFYDEGKERSFDQRITYMAMVESMDKGIGRVVEALKNKGMYRNTLIIFCSDNGGFHAADNRPFRGGKGSSWEGGIHVPTVAVWPGRIKPETESAGLVYVADWYPTFVEAAGGTVHPEEDLDGVSALPVLEGGVSGRENIPIISYSAHAYITLRWSLVLNSGDYYNVMQNKLEDAELYDLDADISQENDLSADMPRIRERLIGEFTPHIQQIIRGQYNWDLEVARHYMPPKTKGHFMDWVIDDMPEVIVSGKEPCTDITIAPVCREFRYDLLVSRDGGPPEPVRSYMALEDQDEYSFHEIREKDEGDQYRIDVSYHFGLPGVETFSCSDEGGFYELGPLAASVGNVVMQDLGAPVAGMLPVSDALNPGRVFIRDENLGYKGWPESGGLLSLEADHLAPEVSLTRYLISPKNKGIFYISLLMQYDGGAGGNRAGLKLLRRITGLGTKEFLSVDFDGNDVFAEHMDGLGSRQKTKVGGHHAGTICIAMKLTLGTTGNDSISVYLNPPAGADAPAASDAEFRGEFSFDRIKFENIHAGGEPSRLKIDEIRIGHSWQDVMPL